MDEFEMETEEKEKFPLTFEDLLLFEGRARGGSWKEGKKKTF